MSLDHVWLKGVPMELGRRYYPKPPLRFKDIDIYIPLDALENDYDFTEERRVLAEVKMWEEEKRKQKLEEECRIREAEELMLRMEEEERLRLEEELVRQEQESASLPQTDDPHSSNTLTDQEISGELSKLDLDEDEAVKQVEPESPQDFSEKEVVCPQNSEETVPPPHAPPPNGYQFISDSNPMQIPMYSYNMPPPYYNYYIPQPPPVGVQAAGLLQHSGLPYPPGSTGRAASILQPQAIQPTPASTSSQDPSSNSGTTTNSPSGSEQSSTAPPKQKVDLSDFESDTANPFDNVELKSINDMEVLASVLKSSVPILNSHPPLTVSPGSSYANGGPPLGYYHPTPLYPPTSQAPQCPYPNWTPQNGYYVSPQPPPPTPASTSSTAVTSGPSAPVGTSHIPSPTTQPLEQATPTTVNSFTKLHFPFLTSMAQSRASRDRENLAYSNLYRGYHPPSSSEDITSQNPFLSSYVQQPISHSPLQHQYWPLSHPPQQQTSYPASAHPTTTTTPVQNGPGPHSSGTASAAANLGGCYISGPSAPPGSQHALR